MVALVKNSDCLKQPYVDARFTRLPPGQSHVAAVKVSLVLKRARIYDPTTGEFTSRDPLEYVDGMSQYRGYFGLGNLDPVGIYVVNLQIDAFIPFDWVGLAPAKWMKGDDRDVSETPLALASTRALSTIDVELEECVREEPEVPGTEFSGITPTTRRGWTAGKNGGYYYETRRGTFDANVEAVRTGPCSVKVAMKMHATVPWELAPGGPAIDFEYTFELHIFEVEGSGVVITGIQNGKHDGFPGHESYVQNKLVYSYDPRTTGETPLSLFPPMEHSMSDNKISLRDREGSVSCCCKGTIDEWRKSLAELKW